MVNMKAVLLGVLTAVVIVLALLMSSSIAAMEENKVYHTTEITISGKACGDEILGENVSKIQGEDGLIYFIPYNDCKLYPIGMHGTIFYNHVCPFSLKETSMLQKSYCFNETVGDYP